MTNPTPSEFDAKLDGILKADLLEFFEAYKEHSYRYTSEPFVIDDWKHTKAEQAIRAAVREIVPKPKPTDLDYGYQQGRNAAIAEMLARIGDDDAKST